MDRENEFKWEQTNLNPCPINNFISNSLLCIHLSFSRSPCLFLNYLQLRHHVFTTFDARIRNVKCKNKNVLSLIYFEDFKTSKTFLFLHSTFLIRASNVVKTCCLLNFASSSSLIFEHIPSLGTTISQKRACSPLTVNRCGHNG